MEERAPALVSTRTLWPASVRAFTPEGTIPTRDSWSLTSFGTPINICFLPHARDAGGSSFGSIDLRALQLVGVVDINRFPLRVEVDGAQAAFPMPVAGGLSAAKRQVHFGADRRRVHVGDAGIDITHGQEGLIHIARIDRRREPIGHAVRDLNRLLESVTRDQTDHRAEDLFLGNSHLGVNFGEYRGFKKPSMH